MQYGNITPNQLDADVFEVVFDTILSSAATSVDITGLDGDVDEIYILKIRLIGGTVAVSNAQITFNSDASAAYGRQFVNGQSTTLAAGRTTTDTQMSSGLGSGQNEISKSEFLIYAKTGNERLVLLDDIVGITSTTVDTVSSSGNVWSNTASNIISIQVKTQNALGLGIGTQVTLSRKRKR